MKIVESVFTVWSVDNIMIQLTRERPEYVKW